MAELVEALGELKAVPDAIHILCPRQSDDDMTLYEDDYAASLQKDIKPDPVLLQRIEEAKARREKFLSCMKLLAFNGEEVADEQSWIYIKLQTTLERCDLCIKEYHKGKLWLMSELKEEGYDEGEVEKFGKILDEWDVKRICRNLDAARDMLKSVPPEQRTLSTLDRPTLLSIFEALSCSAMLDDAKVMSEHFDEPFRLVQTKRLLKILDYVPASTKLLFDPDPFRGHWAATSWCKYNRPPSNAEFEWAIKDPLTKILQIGSVPPVPEDVVLRLWRGMHLIVRRLDKNQITHNLRALEIDPIRLSVDHLGVTTPALRPLINTIRTLVEKAAGDFWEAMQTISPQALIEIIFHNPQYERFLMEAANAENAESQATFNDMLAWIEPFMASLKGDHRPQACRTLVSQLLDRLQRKPFCDRVKYHCFVSGLSVLIGTLRTYTDNESSRGSVARVVLSDTLEVIAENIDRFLQPPKFEGVEEGDDKVSMLCMDVIRNTLALECQSLASDYDTILRSNALQHGVSTYSSKIWHAVVSSLRDNNLPLSSAALLGITPLVGLEKFISKSEPVSEQKAHFNKIYAHLTRLSCQILERLSEFSTAHINALLEKGNTNRSLVSALFSADMDTYQAAVDLIKAVSGQPGRREAIAHLFESFSAATILGFGWSFRRISKMKTFASAPRMVKTGSDIVTVLCDSEIPGLLRKKLDSTDQAIALQTLWEYMWQALSTIFEYTEQWHQMGNERKMMEEFCRDVIQFAALLFDQFSVFTSAIGDFDSELAQPAKSALLFPLTSTMRWMVKWLRLKDEYLLQTDVDLVLKVLHYFGERKVTIPKDATSFIEGVALTSTVKTILSDNQKAELVRALESYYGKPLVPAPTKEKVTVKQTAVPTKTVMKQSRIDGFAQPAGAAGTTTSMKVKKEEEEFDDIPDDVLLEMAGATEMQKRMGLQSKPATPTIPSRKPPALPLSKPATPLVAPKSAAAILSFREKREKEKEAKKKRDALELARLKSKFAATKAVTNEDLAHSGSGLLGLQVPIADHGPPRESMMVSSESESESEEESDDGDLLGGRRRSTVPDAVRAYQESKKRLTTHVPVKKTKVVRSAKDMRARLMPDLSALHRVLLSWDPFAHRGSDFPPNSGRTDYSLVSSVFPNAAEYQRTFEPLLMLESWQSIQSVIEEGTFRPWPVKILTRLNVDSFVEIITSMTPQDHKNIGIGEADLVVLSTKSNPTDDRSPKCLARIARCKKQKGMMEIVYRLNVSSPILKDLMPTKDIFAAKITSLTPMEREYGALMALQYYDLSDEITRAQPSPILNYTPESLRPFERTYNLNAAQAKAVKSALDNDAFTLIQGPPGSGKTKTICALVGALLSSSLGGSGSAVRIPGADFKPATHGTNAKKLLICAPSNAAIDELVMRLKAGGKTLDGRDHQLNVVRFGRSDAINANVIDVTLDELVSQKLSGIGRKTTDDPSKLFDEHKATCNQFNEVRTQMDAIRSAGHAPPPELLREFDILKQKKTQLSTAIDSARDNRQSALRDEQVARRKAQQDIINSAHVICATLSGSGHEMFQSLSVEFETVIIDEAAQSIELSALIPLKYGCSKCILVGDPKQLPPTVLSKEAARFQYEQSLFVRMQENHPKDVHLLDTQYRMHPQISAFPSAAFYDGRLKNGPNMEALRKRVWHNSELLCPYRFFDVQGMHSNATKGHSLINYAEMRVAMKLYERLITDYRSKYDFAQKIGIITPYKGQLRLLKNEFSAKYGKTIFEEVEFNTTDAFQGRECEVIIFSCVRASNRGIGFLSDIRRMNVGLTRAKSSLWVLGNSSSLVQGQFWRALIEDATKREVYTTGDVLKMLDKPQIHLDAMYDDVEMADPGTEPPSKAATPALPSEGDMPPPRSVPTSVDMGSARSSPSISLGRRTESVKSTPSASPRLAPKVDGPSGGGNGLNEAQMCGRCGSYEHMTHACDNEDAKVVSQGACLRCKKSGHSRRDCTISRCLRCGGFGHETRACKSQKELSRRDKDRVRWEENKHDQIQKAKALRQRQRQLGDHDRKVPSIAVGDNQPKPAQNKEGNNAKRRRDEANTGSAPGNRDTKKPRAAPAATMPPKLPKGRKFDPATFAPPPDQLYRPVKRQEPKIADPAVAAAALKAGENRPPNTKQKNTNKPPRPNEGPNQGHNQGQPPQAPHNGQNPPPRTVIMRKRKPADPFIRPKKRGG
ncbi:hypothetical protein KEM56_004657 [Ascosphaera pollenicola]|nr:hypothetical protein KEM56_004657 [Ascosphaera pollenicola]